MQPKMFDKLEDFYCRNLFSSKNIFVIPQYQRSYKWTYERLIQLEEDILEIAFGENRSEHFLGAIIIHDSNISASKTVFSVIDGQQRLTTIYIYLLALAYTLASKKQFKSSADLLKKSLISDSSHEGSNILLRPCLEDQKELNEIFKRLSLIRGFDSLFQKLKVKEIEIKETTKLKKGNIAKNFDHALTFFSDQFKNGGSKRLEKIKDTIMNDLILVQIVVKKAEDGPRIFDCLNSRQAPMSIGDLVRNEIFTRVGGDQDTIKYIDIHFWQPFFKKFKVKNKNYFEAYFFPYGLILNPTLRKTSVFEYLKKQWSKEKSAEDIIDKLSSYQVAFLDLITGSNELGLPKTIATRLEKFHLLKAPSATFPFLMRLMSEIKRKKISTAEASKIIDVVESFLVRRALCGMEPTGLHAVFKKLWSDCEPSPTAKKVIVAINEHKTVKWPDMEMIKTEILSRDLYESGITRYFLKEYDLSLAGEVGKNKELVWIEHVLPQTLTREWRRHFSEQEHEIYLNTLPNLLPMTGSLNSELGNKPYAVKREAYKDRSMFKSVRDFANENASWDVSSLQKRAEKLLRFIERRWKY